MPIFHLVSRAIAAPELASVVVGPGAEHVPQRMPGEAPHKTVVRRLHSSYVSLVADKPEEYGTI